MFLKLNIYFCSMQIILRVISLSRLLSSKCQPLKSWSTYFEKHTRKSLAFLWIKSIVRKRSWSAKCFWNRTPFNINSIIHFVCKAIAQISISKKKFYLPSAYLYGIWSMKTHPKPSFSAQDEYAVNRLCCLVPHLWWFCTSLLLNMREMVISG